MTPGPADRGGRRCVVLMYHVIDTPATEAERQWCCEPWRFGEQMRWLRDSGHVPVGMDTVAAWLDGRGELPRNAVCVTFDDGTRCLRETALPILREFDVPATAYVVAGLLGADNDWLRADGWSRRALLDAADLRALRDSGVTLGSHSLTHADLSRVDDDAIRREVADSRTRLEDTLGAAVDHFAYPFGRLRRHAYDAVREAGYRTAVTVADGAVRRGDDPLLLSRVEVYHWDDLERFGRKVRWGAADPELSARSLKRVARRLLQFGGIHRPRLPA
ncbi:MAG: polysaccharide deacetylase family protein [Burkholderiaceae bacterium]|nr:polysaccharide deacetylase family protein [Burkholderiaceae bacterium]